MGLVNRPVARRAPATFLQGPDQRTGLCSGIPEVLGEAAQVACKTNGIIRIPVGDETGVHLVLP